MKLNNRFGSRDPRCQTTVEHRSREKTVGIRVEYANVVAVSAGGPRIARKTRPRAPRYLA